MALARLPFFSLFSNTIANMKISSKYIWLVILPVILIGLYLFYRNSYIRLQPIQFTGESFIEFYGDSVFNKNLEQVLGYNGVPYKLDDKGQILVKRSLNADKELVWNYTSRALENDWLASHPYPPGSRLQVEEQILKFDTSRFNKKYDLDFSTCKLFFGERDIEERLSDEYAIVKRNDKYTILATSKYERLWVCKLSPHLVKVNDTVVVTGLVYAILGSERMPGRPTVLTGMIAK
jgi:hypothetical protein